MSSFESDRPEFQASEIRDGGGRVPKSGRPLERAARASSPNSESGPTLNLQRATEPPRGRIRNPSVSRTDRVSAGRRRSEFRCGPVRSEIGPGPTRTAERPRSESDRTRGPPYRRTERRPDRFETRPAPASGPPATRFPRRPVQFRTCPRPGSESDRRRVTHRSRRKGRTSLKLVRRTFRAGRRGPSSRSACGPPGNSAKSHRVHKNAN